MYLSLLSNEEKSLFLDTVYNLAVSDGEYSEEEKEKMKLYCQEVKMEFDEGGAVKSIDQIVKEISQTSSMRSKKIIIFEALGMALADNKFLDSEREIIEKMIFSFGLSEGFIAQCESFIREYLAFQDKLNSFIL